MIALIIAGLIVLKLAVQFWLDWLNHRHVLAHANAVPEAFKEVIDPATYAKSIQYTLAKSRFGRVEDTYDTAVLLAVLFSGVLPWTFSIFTGWFGTPAWAMAACLFVIGMTLSLSGLPFNWYADFHLEQRFGFNTANAQTWWADRLKGLLLALALGYPLLVLVLKFVEWTGAWWWLWAWGALLGFQLVMAGLAPVLILPLFNKFTPLPEGGLRDRLLALAERAGFRARAIEVMDGSKRSRHSNAFFTGLGRFRKIVLFDTLVQQLSGPELEAVLAHEIAHFKLKHILKNLLLSATASLGAFYLVSLLARADWFCRSFGFEPGNLAPALFLFGLLAGAASFWCSPLAHGWSRRCEYQADAFAVRVMNTPQPLIAALRRLNEKNLSNLTPHPLYSGFYYSHPTLLERRQALLCLPA